MVNILSLPDIHLLKSVGTGETKTNHNNKFYLCFHELMAKRNVIYISFVPFNSCLSTTRFGLSDFFFIPPLDISSGATTKKDKEKKLYFVLLEIRKLQNRSFNQKTNERLTRDAVLTLFIGCNTEVTCATIFVIIETRTYVKCSPIVHCDWPSTQFST